MKPGSFAEELGLAEQCVLITGASQGSGRASAQTFAAAGTHVVACGRSRQRLFSFAESQRARGYHIVPRIADIASASDAKRLVEFALQRYGRLDVVI